MLFVQQAAVFLIYLLKWVFESTDVNKTRSALTHLM